MNTTTEAPPLNHKTQAADAAHDAQFSPGSHVPDREVLEVELIPLELIDHPYPNHRTVSDARLQVLAASIAQEGLQQPIEVCLGEDVGRYTLVFGEQRLKAHRILDWVEVKAQLVPRRLSAEEVYARRGIENFHRQDLRTMERVSAAEQMVTACGGDRARAAVRLSIDDRQLEDLLYLGERLSPEVQSLALMADLPLTYLRELTKIGDPALQWDVTVRAAGASGSWWDKPGKPCKGKIYTYGMDSRTGAQAVAEFEQALAAGQVQRMSLSELRGEVAAAQRSLKTTPWDYALPVVVPGRGKGKKADLKLPACAGCPSNSETDHTLFGTESDDQNPRGLCLNPACYRQKTEAAEQAKAALVKSFSRRKQAPKPAEIDAKTPDWLKTTTARGVVQRSFKKAGGGQGEAKASSPQPAKTAEAAATQKLHAAEREWEDGFMKSLIDKAKRDPFVIVLASMLRWHPEWSAFKTTLDARRKLLQRCMGLKVLADGMATMLAKEIADAGSDQILDAVESISDKWALKDAGQVMVAEVLNLGLPPFPQAEDFQPKANDHTPKRAPKRKTKAGKA